MQNFLFFLLLSFSTVLSAQWSSDPENPNILGQITGTQKRIFLLNDSSDGIFAFWLDNRILSTRFDLYGQHYNNEGVPSWEGEGRLLVNEATSVELFKATLLPDSRFCIVWQYNAPAGNPANDGKIKCQTYDLGGNAIWANPTVIGEISAGNPSLFVVRDFYTWTFDNRIYLGWFGEAFGANLHRFVRVDFNGQLLSPFQGHTVSPFIYASASLIPDGFGGIYFHSKSSNGASFGIAAHRYDSLGTPQWSAITAIVPEVNMGGSYTAIADTSGLTVFYSTTNLLLAQKISAAGQVLWPGQPKIICDAAGTHLSPKVILEPDAFQIIWADSRSGAIGQYAVYGQRTDLQMNRLWNPEGLLLSNQNTVSINDMDLALYSENESNYLLIQKAGQEVFATKFDENGTLLSPVGDIPVILPPAASPVQNDFDAAILGNHAVAAWSNGNDAYLVCFSGCTPTIVNLSVTACNEYSIDGQTFDVSGNYTIPISADTLLELELTIVEFSPVIVLEEFTINATQGYDTYTWISCSDQSIVQEGSSVFNPEVNGDYSLIASLGECIDTTECISVTGLSIEGTLQNQIRFFPNPASEMINLKIPNEMSSSISVKIYDSTGRLLFHELRASQQTISIPITDFIPGFYQLQLTGNANTYFIPWIKTHP